MRQLEWKGLSRPVPLDIFILVWMGGWLPSSGHEYGCSRAQIAEELGCARERATARIEKLISQRLMEEVNGQVELRAGRTSAPLDKRVSSVKLTKKGRKLAENLQQAVETFSSQLVRNASHPENPKSIDLQMLTAVLVESIGGRLTLLEVLERMPNWIRKEVYEQAGQAFEPED